MYPVYENIEYAKGRERSPDKRHVYYKIFDISRFTGSRYINPYIHFLNVVCPISDLSYAVRHLSTSLPDQSDSQAFTRSMLNGSCHIEDAKRFIEKYNKIPAFRNIGMIDIINANCVNTKL